MNKILLTLLSMILTVTLFGQSSQRTGRPLTERQKIINEIDREIAPGVVLDFLRKTDFAIKNETKKGKDISYTKLSKFANAAKIYLDYRWFIADTGLSKSWMKKVYELLAYMSKIKRYMQTAEFNGRTKTAKYKKAVEYFNIACKRFNELMKKPMRMDSKVVQNERLNKDMWQRAMRKKYNIKKENSSNSFF